MGEVSVSASFKRQSAFLIIICGSLFLLSSLVLKPLYILAGSDIVWQDTFVIPLLEIFLNLFEIFAYSMGFASVIYSVFFFNNKKAITIIAEFMVLSILRRIIDIIFTIVIYGAIDTLDVKVVLFSVFMEFVQIFVLFIITSSIAKKETDVSIPFKKIYSKKNALQVSALWAGVILSAVKIVSRIIYDIDFGAPEHLIEIISMILFYSLDVSVALIAYITIIFILAKIHRTKIFEKA